MSQFPSYFCDDYIVAANVCRHRSICCVKLLFHLTFTNFTTIKSICIVQLLSHSHSISLSLSVTPSVVESFRRRALMCFRKLIYFSNRKITQIHTIFFFFWWIWCARWTTAKMKWNCSVQSMARSLLKNDALIQSMMPPSTPKATPTVEQRQSNG